MASVVNEPAVIETCPGCSIKARNVAPLTVRSLAKPELADTVKEGAYRFCASPTCDVVYFSQAEPDHRFLRSDLRVRVGQKATEPPIQVCYCFDWTTDDIEREFRLTSTTSIPDRIKEKIQQGLCHCETMNPQGSCCLGNVNKAVKEIRTKLAVPKAAAGKPHHGNGNGEAVGTVPLKPGQTKKEKGAWLATLGAIFTGVVGSACCWLPLLLIAFGFSAAGAGSFFEQYRPYLLTATFALLGLAWYLTYRTALQRVWGRLTGRRRPMPAVEACCPTEPLAAPTDSCCATEPEPVDCCAPQTCSATGQAVRQRFSMRQFNQVMLWVATVVILLLALFPHWVGLILGSGGSQRTGTTAPDDQAQLVLRLDGMTCEGCAATVQQALRKVPGVIHVEVNYTRSEALVTTDKCCSPSPDPLIRAVRDAGYDAQVKK
jgi:copper chaperone CopZ